MYFLQRKPENGDAEAIENGAKEEPPKKKVKVKKVLSYNCILLCSVRVRILQSLQSIYGIGGTSIIR